MNRNPLAEAIKEANRRQGTNANGRQATRSRTTGTGLPGNGLPAGDDGAMNLTPDGTFTIGVSDIGGDDEIG